MMKSAIFSTFIFFNSVNLPGFILIVLSVFLEHKDHRIIQRNERTYLLHGNRETVLHRNHWSPDFDIIKLLYIIGSVVFPFLKEVSFPFLKEVSL